MSEIVGKGLRGGLEETRGFKRAPVGENEQGLTEDTRSLASSPTTSREPKGTREMCRVSSTKG